jgi:putative oxidoreductase
MLPIVTRLETARERLLALAHRLGFLAPLLIRLTLGVVFIQTGWGHLTHMNDTIQNFRDDFGVPLPELSARLASVTEFFGGILMLLGLGTRLAALPMAFVMLVAIATARGAAIEGFTFDGFTALLGLEEWSYLIMFLTIVVIGPGGVSVDAFIARKLNHGHATPTTLRPSEAPAGHV